MFVHGIMSWLIHDTIFDLVPAHIVCQEQNIPDFQNTKWNLHDYANCVLLNVQIAFRVHTGRGNFVESQKKGRGVWIDFWRLKNNSGEIDEYTLSTKRRVKRLGDRKIPWKLDTSSDFYSHQRTIRKIP